jgi:hypothetical protein
MTEGHATLFTREWWITVFLVGLGIHLCAQYLKPRLDQIGGWFSRSWATRNKRRAHERQVRIDQLRRDETARWLVVQKEFRRRLQGLFFLGLSLFFCVLYVGLEVGSIRRHVIEPSLPMARFGKIPEVICLLAALLAIFPVLDTHFDASRISAELREALDKRDETKTPSAGNDDPEDILPRQF